MSKSWDKKIASANKGIERSRRALAKYKDRLKRAVKRTPHCRSSTSKRMNANSKNHLRRLIDRSKKKIEKHKKAIQYYRGRKSGRIKASNLKMSDFTR